MPVLLASSDDGAVCMILSLGVVVFIIVRAFRSKPDEDESASSKALPSTYSAPVRFDPFTDLRTTTGIKGTKVFLMLRQDQEGVPESLTLNDDFIAIGRCGAEVQAFLLDDQTVLRLNLGALPQYADTRYHMVLSRGADVVQLPVSFRGWMEFFDACKKAGGALEAADEISDQMRVIVLGQRGASRGTSSEATSSPKVLRPTKCPACGALLGKRGPCEYCGALV